jgi:uncharacterized protein involved in type VI secretion and phage assembly
MMILSEFIEDIYRFGLERFRKFYGPYAAIVINNQDPEGKGRIQVSCPRAKLGADSGIWLWPMFVGAGTTNRNNLTPGAPQNPCGFFWVPPVSEMVFIFFDNGDPTKPLCWTGGIYGGVDKSELSPDMAPDATNTPIRKGFITDAGSELIFDDTSGSEQITIKLQNGNQVLIMQDQIMVGTVGGSFEPMIKGSTAKQWLDNHVHDSPYGPTSPPTEPLPDDALSSITKTS